MSKNVTFYFDFVSPYSYLAYTRLSRIQKRTDATFILKPIHILTVMNEVGNVPTSATCPAKAKYARQDLLRWARHYDTKINPHPKFGTFSTEPLLLAALAAESRGQLAAFTKAAFEAVWLNKANLEKDDEVCEWLTEAGIRDASEVWGTRDDFEAMLHANHRSAIADGVFGVPSFRTKTSLYFGNDRTHFLEAELSE